MKGAEVHGVLRAELGPWLKESGSRRSRELKSGWELASADRVRSIWAQLDKRGWDPHLGSRFFVNFRCAAPVGGSVREERLNFFLTDAELEEARAYHNEVVARAPAPAEEYFAALEQAFAASPDRAAILGSVRAMFEPDPTPWRRHQDISLSYWRAEDVAGWARFILRVLPRAVDEMGRWVV